MRKKRQNFGSKPWSFQDVEQLKGLLKAHVKQEEIAKILKRTTPSVKSYMYAHGIRCYSGDCAKYSGWTDSERMLLCTMRQQRKSWRVIATFLGRTECACKKEYSKNRNFAASQHLYPEHEVNNA